MGRIEKTVFVSYRRTDEPWGLAIFQNLTQHGYDVFIDYDGIASGNFETVILENIRARAHFLVLLTPTALERCSDPGDWMRREIEAALDSQRNIVPLMIAGFDFGTSATASQLTGKLAALKEYNGLEIPKGYFSQAMERLRNRFLSVSLDTVLHAASDSAQQVAKEQKDKATIALRDEQRKPGDRRPSQLPETQTTTFEPPELKPEPLPPDSPPLKPKFESLSSGPTPKPKPEAQPPAKVTVYGLLAFFGVLLLAMLSLMIHERVYPKPTILSLEDYEGLLAKKRAEVVAAAAPSGEKAGRVVEEKAKSLLESELGRISIEANYWPNSTVPYEIANSFPDQQRIFDAIKDYEGNTNVRFVERTEQNATKFPNYVQFVAGSGCSSVVGMKGGLQRVTLGPECTVGSILHQLGHVLGLYHEQSRPDRNKYIKIIWDNLMPQFAHNFSIVDASVNMRRPYDYESIMHYPPTAFSKNGKPTIEPLLPTAIIGERNKLSSGDILLINSLYPKIDGSPPGRSR